VFSSQIWMLRSDALPKTLETGDCGMAVAAAAEMDDKARGLLMSDRFPEQRGVLRSFVG
jgi:hypothetical protein